MKTPFVTKIIALATMTFSLGLSPITMAMNQTEPQRTESLARGPVRHHSIQLQVVPLSVKAKVEVVAVKSGQAGMKALIFTGRTARRVAAMAGVALNSGSQMIVATGQGVNTFFADFNLTQLPRRGTELVLFTSKAIGDDALNLVSRTILSGGALVEDTGTTVLPMFGKAIKGSVTVVNETGTVLVVTGKEVLGTSVRAACGLLRAISFGALCSQ